MQTEEEVGQGIQPGLLEHGQEIGVAGEHECGDFIEYVDEDDWDRDQREDRHLPRIGLADRLEQAVERQNQKNEDDLVDQFARDADAHKRRGPPDVVGRRGRVPGDDQLAGHIQEADGGGEPEKEVEDPGDSCLMPRRGHLSAFSWNEARGCYPFSPGARRPIPDTPAHASPNARG